MGPVGIINGSAVYIPGLAAGWVSAAGAAAAAGSVVAGFAGAAAGAGAAGAVAVVSGLGVVEASACVGVASVFDFFLREKRLLKIFLVCSTASGATDFHMC